MMKKITLLLAVLFYGFSLNAQTIYFSEDFEGETAGDPPSTFTILNEDTCSVNQPTLFTNQSFVVTNDADQGNVATAQSWTVPSCQVDDWLITPAIDLTPASGIVRLDWLSTSNQGFFENYNVLLSTTGNAIADFTVTLETNVDEPDAWTSHSVDLSAYVGSTIYIAFNLISEDKDALSIDDITVLSPPANDLVFNEVTAVGGHSQTLNGYIPGIVVDFSDRNNVEFDVNFTNVGTSAADSIIISTTISNASNTVQTTITDTIVNALAPLASYTHTSSPIDFATAFPALATDEPLFIEVALEASNSNTLVEALDSSELQYIISPLLSYTAPFAASFELGGITHADFSWKYMDNDNDGNTFDSYAFTNIETQAGSYSVFGSIINGNQPSQNATDETLQSPEVTLTGGTAYEFSIYASSLFNLTAGFDMVLIDGAGVTNTPLGTVNLSNADSTLQKYTFQSIIPATQADYMVNINKNSTGVLILDLFEITELSMPVSPTVNNSWDACDKEASVTFNVENGNSYTVDWGDGSAIETVTSSPATHVYTTAGATYTATVTAQNILGSANATTTVDATELTVPDATFILNPSATTASVAATQNLSCNTYTWVYGDGSPNGSGVSDSHTYTANGEYTITLLVENSAGTTTSTQTMTVTTIAINEIDFTNGINVFPNPVSDVLNISFELNSAQDAVVELVSIDGRIVSSVSSNNTTVVNEAINTSKLSTGMYILNVTTDEGKFTKNIMVK